MRIVMIGPFGLTPKSSMQARAWPLARALAALGHQVKLVMPPWHTKEPARVWQDAGVELEYVTTSRLPVLGYLLITMRLVRSALAFKPQVVHCFKPKAYSGLAALILRFRQRLGLKVRLVVDEDDWEGSSGWNDLEHYPWLMKRFFAWQENWGLTHCDALTVASRALQTIAWSHGIASKKVFYLPNGSAPPSPPARANRNDLGFGQTPLVLLYTRFVEFKVERLVDTWHRIHEEMPAARLLIVGRALLQEADDELNTLLGADLEQSVTQVGWIPQEELSSYFQCATIALFPCDDTLVNRCKCSAKLTDLLSAGVPVIADAVGQNCEYIRDGQSGLLVPPADNKAMALAALELLRDESMRHRLGQAAKQFMAQVYAWDKLVEVVLNAYEAQVSP
ncbi:MAG: glycosyltransferase family 4 protein [Anaerolineae bacterium]